MYTLIIHRRVQRALGGLSVADSRRIAAAIDALAHDPRPPGCVKLTNRPGWRVRVGDYRIIYDVDDATRTVTILDVGHRRNVYR